MPEGGAAEEKQTFFEELYAARDSDANEICDGLFLGAASAAGDKAAMQKRRISHVVVAHPALPEQHPQSFKYRRVSVIDEPGTNLLELLPDALDFLAGARAAGGKVFVYCAKGISRSSSIVIALLMLEHGIGFEAAWGVCEQRRPIVYPNVGFQQQLRHLEALLAAAPQGEDGWRSRLRHLRAAVPRGSLMAPESPLRLQQGLDTAASEAMELVEATAARVLSQPALLQGRELWKRHGLFFENLQRYKSPPGGAALAARARAAAERLRTLPKVFSESLRGVKLGLGVAQQLEAWAALPLAKAPPPAAAPEPVAPAAAVVKRDRSPEEARSGAPKDKKQRKLEKKLAKIERKAREAELAVEAELRAAEAAARRAEALAAEHEEAERREREREKEQQGEGAAV